MSAFRTDLESTYGQVWNVRELERDFEVTTSLLQVGERHFVGVKRRADGVEGILSVQATPRFYWGFIPYEKEGA